MQYLVRVDGEPGPRPGGRCGRQQQASDGRHQVGGDERQAHPHGRSSPDCSSAPGGPSGRPGPPERRHEGTARARPSRKAALLVGLMRGVNHAGGYCRARTPYRERTRRILHQPRDAGEAVSARTGVATRSNHGRLIEPLRRRLSSLKSLGSWASLACRSRMIRSRSSTSASLRWAQAVCSASLACRSRIIRSRSTTSALARCAQVACSCRLACRFWMIASY